jgi:hypothetical protein
VAGLRNSVGRIGVDAEMVGADVGDLGLLEEPIAEEITRPRCSGSVNSRIVALT